MEGKSWYEKLRRQLGMGAAAPNDWSDAPSWYQRYGQTVSPMSGDTRVRELPIVVLDAETTGLDPKKDRLLSLGALRLRGNTLDLADQFELYIEGKTKGKDWQEAVAIHGILPDSNRHVRSDPATAVRQLLAYIGGALVIGHHIGFDRTMIDRTLREAGAGPLLNPVVDTAHLAERLKPKGYWSPPGEYSLDELARRYRIPLSDRHTALGDSYITGVLWLKLLARLEDKLGREVVWNDLRPRR